MQSEEIVGSRRALPLVIEDYAQRKRGLRCRERPVRLVDKIAEFVYVVWWFRFARAQEGILQRVQSRTCSSDVLAEGDRCSLCLLH